MVHTCDALAFSRRRMCPLRFRMIVVGVEDSPLRRCAFFPSRWQFVLAISVYRNRRHVPQRSIKVFFQKLGFFWISAIGNHSPYFCKNVNIKDSRRSQIFNIEGSCRSWKKIVKSLDDGSRSFRSFRLFHQ